VARGAPGVRAIRARPPSGRVEPSATALACATAAVAGDALLFVGAEFRLTDIPAAL
jgi:hypothetical protein